VDHLLQEDPLPEDSGLHHLAALHHGGITAEAGEVRADTININLLRHSLLQEMSHPLHLLQNRQINYFILKQCILLSVAVRGLLLAARTILLAMIIVEHFFSKFRCS